MKRRLLPQRLALPSAREAHGGDVDGRVSGEQGIDLRLHVVIGRNDVEEILDDAKIEIDAEGIGRQCNPTARHAGKGHHGQVAVTEKQRPPEKIKRPRNSFNNLVDELVQRSV